MSNKQWNSTTTGRNAAALIIAIGMLLVGGSGCQTVTEPVTGRRQVILTSADAEMRMGLDAWNEIVKTEKLSTNAAKIAAVERVGRNLSVVVNEPGFNWEFRVFASDQANAFCLPGGKVGIYEGLFAFTANDAELATVIGHEIGHAVARHGGERMTHAMMVNFGALGVNLATRDASAEKQAVWMAAYMGASTLGFVLPYSRTHEYAADELGLVYMAKAGYDPHAALSFWQKFGAQDKGRKIPEFLSTHPVGDNRLQRLQERIPSAMLSYELAPVRRGFGQIYEEKK